MECTQNQHFKEIVKYFDISTTLDRRDSGQFRFKLTYK